MEHLLLPRGASVSESERAPYIADVYDSSPFLDYPRRSRFRILYEKVLPLDGYPSTVETFADREMRELEVLVQTWLVFGLFHEIFGSLASQSDFIIHRSTSKSPRLNMDLLPQVVDRWVASNYGVGDESERKCQLEHLIVCLKLASRFLLTLRKQPNIELTVLWSTASIVEALEDIVCETLDDPLSTRSLGLMWAECYRREQLVETMIGNGWCPAEARRWIKGGESLQVIYYLSKLKRINTKDHSKCVGSVCSAFQYDLENGRVTHRCRKEDCGELVIDTGPIKAAFDEGFIAMLDVTGEEDFETMTVSVVSSKENLPYVALSHVWADGLGNPAANSLPRCQVSYVATIVKELQKKTNSGRLLFWLDTICCPVDSPRHRAQCLAKMRQIYQNAAHVLVLDRALSHYAADEIDCVEIGVRTIFSAWTCRLWTLQEGALASNLWVQMKDCAVDLDLVEGEVSRLYKTRFIHHSLLLIVVSYMRRLRQLKSNNDMLTPRSSRPPDIITVQMALKNRSVSVASDEALCLCTLLDLDQLSVVQALPEDRMYIFWSTAASKGTVIPKHIVFFTGPRSDHPGIRWAPRSFLGEVNFYSFRRPKSQDETATVTPDGLLAEFPAVELHLHNIPPETQDEYWNGILSDMPNARWMREVEHVWYMVIYPPDEKLPSEDPLAQAQRATSEERIVAINADSLHALESGSHGNDVTLGLLGRIVDNQNSVIKFRLARPVYVARLKESLSRILEAVYQHSSIEQISSIHVQLPKDHSEVPLTKDEFLSRLPNAMVAGLLDIAETTFERSPEVVNTFVQPDVSGATSKNHQLAVLSFAVWLTFFIAGRTGEIRHLWPRDQRWCVD